MSLRSKSISLWLVLSLLSLGLVTGIGQTAKVTLRMAHCHTGDDEKLWEELLAEFHKRYPEITVKYEAWEWPMVEKLLVAAAGNAMPDLFYVFPAAFMKTPEQLLLDLAPYMARDGIKPADYICPDPILGPKGQIYSLPYDTNGWFTVYNAELFDKAGLLVPGDDFTWIELGEAAKKLTRDANGDGIPEFYGFRSIHMSYFSEAYVTGFGAKWITDGKVTANSPEMRKAWSFWISMINQKYANPSLGAMNDWNAGKVGMAFTDCGWIPAWSNPKDGLQFSWGAAPLPREQGLAKRTIGMSGQFAIAAKTKYPNEAWELIKFLTGPEAAGIRATKRGWFPGSEGAVSAWVKYMTSVKAAGGNPPQNLPMVLDAVKLAKAPSYVATGRFWDIDTIITKHLDSALSNKIPIEQALENIQREANSLLSRK